MPCFDGSDCGSGRWLTSRLLSRFQGRLRTRMICRLDRRTGSRLRRWETAWLRSRHSQRLYAGYITGLLTRFTTGRLSWLIRRICTWRYTRLSRWIACWLATRTHSRLKRWSYRWLFRWQSRRMKCRKSTWLTTRQRHGLCSWLNGRFNGGLKCR